MKLNKVLIIATRQIGDTLITTPLISAIKKKWLNGFIGKQPYQLSAKVQKVDNVAIIQGPGECVPCRKAGCEDKADSRSDCLVNLSVQQALEAVNLFNIKLD
jgi:ADP-heptose:LPS heptosyltransferase